MHQGGCLCGRVRYVVTAAPSGTNYCHCSQCRKASGSAFAVNAGIARDAFRLTAGKGDLSYFESSPGKRRFFCGTCGSPIFSQAGPGTVYVRVGTLDDADAVTPDVHIHVASKVTWFEIADDLPRCEAEEGLWF